VFVDIDRDSWCLSVDSFKQAITPRTKAVLAIDLYGNMPEMHRVRAVARARGIAIVEDASDALGGEYFARRAGSLGDVGVFGFHRSETITSGEGGMVVTSCDQIGNKIREYLADAGFEHHISPMQAALGLAQLERIDELVDRKRRVIDWYVKALGGVPHVETSRAPLASSCVPSEFTVITHLANDVMVRELSNRGIECTPMYCPASSLNEFSNTLQAQVARSRNRVSYKLSRYGVSLPSGTNLTHGQVAAVAAAVRRLVMRQSQERPLQKAA
jgi:perosamine synthetase